MSKRFQTYFGVPIPPFKERKLGAGSSTIRFVLVGRVPSKKNNQQAVAVRKAAYEYLKSLRAKGPRITHREAMKAIKLVRAKVRPNKQYQAFVAAQKPVLLEQMATWSARLRDKGLLFPINRATLSIRFYFQSQHKQDTLNKQQSIQDLLQEAGVISEDDYTVINPIHSAAGCYHEEIVDSITFISISYK